ncbi:hypothetical protein [Chlorogloeopsis sp. ULAP02]|uniref:hypothetical protein n=1 Tax=Chlorogloeopsis sp. ULAP02 TaxID=3107926 RepID=UPI0031359EB8
MKHNLLRTPIFSASINTVLHSIRAIALSAKCGCFGKRGFSNQAIVHWEMTDCEFFCD